VQSSPRRERFGRGAVEGVLGPGAANNSTLGGSLIPTIAFGVPGGVATAILLGAFIIQGLVPGPSMLTPESRGGHLGLTFSFVWTIVIANFVTVAICFLFLKQLAKVTLIRGSLLIPPVLLLIYLGAFAEKNTFEDLYLVLVFGLLGWVMVRLDWPRPPLILGLVLGPLAENRLFLATDNYGADWLTRPWVLALAAVSIAGAVYPLLKARARAKELPASAVPAKAPRYGWETLFAFALVAVLAVALWDSRDFGFRAGLFPWAIGIPVFALAALQLALQLAGRVRRPAQPHPEIPAATVKRRTVEILGWILGYLAAIWLVGFVAGGVLCTFLSLKLGSRERWPLAIGMSAGMGLFIYGLFVQGLHVPFPEPLLASWLGLGPYLR